MLLFQPELLNLTTDLDFRCWPCSWVLTT